jgi:FkbM family methyltransferase
MACRFRSAPDANGVTAKLMHGASMRHRVGLLAKARATAGFVGFVRNWPSHYWATHGWTRPTRLVYELRNGLLLEARPRTLDAAVLKDVFFHQIYARHGGTILDNAIILDIGAHIGAFSASAARAARGVTVYAFEPAPENLELLSNNVARNRLSNVRVSAQAVSGRPGTRQLHLSDSPAGHSLHGHEPSERQLAVETVTLDEILSRHAMDAVDLLKMDCEGAEYEILEGASTETLNRLRRIAMEVHTLDESRTPARLATMLEGHGFNVRLESKGDSTAMIWASRK